MEQYWGNQIKVAKVKEENLQNEIEYLDNNLFEPPINIKTAHYTLTDSDFTILVDATSDAINITVPNALNKEGRIYNIKKIDETSNSVNVNVSLIENSTTYILDSQYEKIRIQSDNTKWWII